MGRQGPARRAARGPVVRAAAAVACAVVALTGCSGGSASTPASASSAGEAGEGPMTAPPAGSSTAAEAPAQGQILPAPVTGGPLLQQPPKQVAPKVKIDGLLAWDTSGYDAATPPAGALQHDHVQGQVSYAVTPPVGGPHNAIWLNAGVYTEPVPSERAVHVLEHGGVWLTYDPGLPADQVTALRAFVEKQRIVPEQTVAGQGNRFVVMSPWSDGSLPSKVVISAWGYQLRVGSADDPRLQAFVDTFRYSPEYSPEYGSPVDGVPVLTGGRPDAFGSLLPNPDGAVG